MKRIFFLILVAALLIITGCRKEDYDDGLKRMTMTVKDKERCALYLAGYGTATIDWGDGSEAETVTLASLSKGYGHRFFGILTNPITLTITGENITQLFANNAGLVNLNVSKNTELTWLECDANKLTDLDVRKNTALTLLYCGRNLLNSLDVSRNTELTRLLCYSNQLKKLDFSANNTELTFLDCHDNLLNNLDVSKLSRLYDLYCVGNQITTLNLHNNIKNLNCSDNQIKTLHVKHTNIWHLDCSNNQIESLDMSENTELRSLYIDGNQFTVDALNTLFGILCNTDVGWIRIANNPGTVDCDRSIAERKGWKVIVD